MTFLYLSIASSTRPASRARCASSINERAISGTSCCACRKTVAMMSRASESFFRALEVYFDLPEHFTSRELGLDAEIRLFGMFVQEVLADDAEADRLLESERSHVIAGARVEE